ncbi:hypothetical protein XENOCAPTIV_002697 [Xenoophorus captivus]|uniref:SH3 domain-containing protein n=1 Tax=Xenoophorus captivus TaxID=1517983 RepID=A0ABV0R2Y7_9TELE
MSLSSDTEGPPPGPLHPSMSCRTNPDIREEDGEGDPTPCVPVQNNSSSIPIDKDKPETDCTALEAGTGRDKADDTVDAELDRTQPKSEAAAGLNYDSIKYTLVVDEHAQLQLVKLKDFRHGYNEHNEDSDAETVYQSANEEEDPETSSDQGDICPDSAFVRRFVPRHADELQLETDDPVLLLKQSEDLWCQGYNMRTGATGIFPAFYAVRVPKDGSYGTLRRAAVTERNELQSKAAATEINSFKNLQIMFYCHVVISHCEQKYSLKLR